MRHRQATNTWTGFSRSCAVAASFVVATVWLCEPPPSDAIPRLGHVPGSARAAGEGDPFATAGVRRFLSGREGEIDAAIYDAQTGVTYCYRPGLKEATASIVKVDILATLLAEAEAAHRSLTVSERDLAGTMIENSDNDAAEDLWEDEGGAAAVARFDERVGMAATTPNVAWGLTTTTACDQVKLLGDLVFPSAVLSPVSRSFELSLLSRVESDQRWGIPSGVPSGIPVDVKNGWLPVEDGWQVNSDAYVHGGGRDYVVSVMTARNPTEGYGIDTIEGLSRYLWSELGSSSVSTGRIEGWH